MMRFLKAIQVLLLVGLCSLTVSTAYGDYNWPYGPPSNAVPPPPLNPKPPVDHPNLECGSFIGCENQSLGESVSVTGTPWLLHYRSERTPGRKDAYTLNPSS